MGRWFVHADSGGGARSGGVGKDFFISYTAADRAWAEWVAWQLEAGGRTVVLQDWDLDPGSNFVLEMDNAIRETERTPLVVSERSLSSPYVRAEWAARLRQDPDGEGRRLVPVRIEACDTEGLLGTIIYVDLVGVDESQVTKTYSSLPGKMHKAVLEFGGVFRRWYPEFIPAPAESMLAAA